MALWKPDLNLLPPRLAWRWPRRPETLAYVVTFDPQRKKPDALCAIDLDSKQSSYAKVVGRVEMPKARATSWASLRMDACSAALCPTRRIRTSSAATLVVVTRDCAPRASTSSTPSLTREIRASYAIIEPEENRVEDRLQPSRTRFIAGRMRST